MNKESTTAIVQRYLIALTGDAPAEPIIREMLGLSARRLERLCGNLLHRQYPRLARPPSNLETEDMVGSLVEGLLKAMSTVRPQTVRQFFALVNQHMRWQLNDLARRLDEQPVSVELREDDLIAPSSGGSAITPDGRQMLQAIENLPEEEREAFELVRFQEMTHSEVAEVLSVSTKTVQRRLNRASLLLTRELRHLLPSGASDGPGAE
jgi:RNA polymerase sigma factor (sigma-70 family)